MIPIFNISSAGGSATTWLTDMLNQHPDVVAFHGLRVNPLDQQERLTPQRMLDLCLFLREHQGGKLCDEVSKKSYGIIHTFYGPEIRQPIKDVGGRFMAIIRDPILRINSLFHHHYRDIMGIDVIGEDVYATLVSRKHLNDIDIPYYRDADNFDASQLTDSELNFRERVVEALTSDLSNYRNTSDDELMQFEKMVASEEYCFEKLAVLLDDESDVLHQVVKGNIGNRVFSHARMQSDSVTIYERWPEQLKRIFVKEASKIGMDECIDMYAGQGYQATSEYLVAGGKQ